MAVLTKSKQVENYLRTSIINGQWSAGDLLPSERDLLSEFNVSRSTLREALNSLANEGLVRRKQGSGTYVADLRQSGSIAITGSAANLTLPMGYWHRDLLDRLQDVIAASGQKSTLWIGTDRCIDDHMSDTALFEATNLQSTNGVINTTLMDRRLDRRLAQQNIHCVNIAYTIPKGRYSVVLDSGTVLHEAARLLIEHGYPDFAILWDPRVFTSKDERDMQGIVKQGQYYEAAVNFNKKRLLEVVTDHFSNCQKAYEAYKEILARPDRPRAIFFADDAHFDIASRVILELGIKVPGELAVVSHANVGREFHFPMSVTRVGFSAHEVSTVAWNMLQKLIAGEDVDEPICYIQPVVMEGDSL